MYGSKKKEKQQKKHNGLVDFIDKTVIIITRSGHWFLGLLRAMDNRGIVLTSVVRLEPERDKNGNIKHDNDLMMAKRVALPFIVPVTNSERYHVRKMYIAYSDIQKVLRAKPESEIKVEEKLWNGK